jgi:hypothetical protein
MHRSLFLLMLLLASCQEEKEVRPDIPCHLRYPPTCKPLVVLEGTKPEVKFLGNQQLNTLTHYLAMQERVESQQVGFSGSFSEVYQGYEALQQQASLEELALLLRHPSPNVRYYALLGLAEKDPKNKVTYYQQLAGKYDTLNTLDGCVGSTGQLWEFTRYQIFESEE